MKIFIYGCILLFYSIPSYNQSLSNQVFANGGTTVSIPQAGTISWSIGELFFETYKGDIHLTQGFHQAYNIIINSLTETETPTNHFRIFPNPAVDQFFVEPTQAGTSNRAILFNLIGQPMQQLIIDGRTAVDLTNYASGMYLLQIIGENGKRQSYKIQKQ
ncbi:MAG: T9SS type A sorting domain-containing protein [Bacteroidota bacterium]